MLCRIVRENNIRTKIANLTNILRKTRADRTKAHLFISVLAISIEHSLKKSGDPRTWKTIRTILSTHRYSILTMKDDKENLYHLCTSDTRDSSHLEIYDALNIKNPIKRKKYIISTRL